MTKQLPLCPLLHCFRLGSFCWSVSAFFSFLILSLPLSVSPFPSLSFLFRFFPPSLSVSLLMSLCQILPFSHLSPLAPRSRSCACCRSVARRARTVFSRLPIAATPSMSFLCLCVTPLPLYLCLGAISHCRQARHPPTPKSTLWPTTPRRQRRNGKATFCWRQFCAKPFSTTS